MAATREDAPSPPPSDRETKKQRTLPPSLSIHYSEGTDAILDVLIKEGAVRVDGVFDDEFCDHVRDGILSYLEGLGTGFSRDKDWRKQAKLLPPQTRSGLMQALVSCIPVLGEVQKSRRLRAIFEVAFSTDQLSVSKDGINVQPPRERKDKRWDHLDQTSGGVFDCIQCVVNLNDTDAGTRVWPRSHLFFDKFRKAHDIKGASNWSMIANDPVLLASAQAMASATPGAREAVVIPSTKGSVTLWLSSVIHSAIDPTRGWRFAHYCTYRPKVEVPGALFGRVMTNREKKTLAKAFRNKRHTNHWGGRLMKKKPGSHWNYIGDSYHPTIMAYLADPTTLPGVMQEEDIDEVLRALYCLD